MAPAPEPWDGADEGEYGEAHPFSCEPPLPPPLPGDSSSMHVDEAGPHPGSAAAFEDDTAAAGPSRPGVEQALAPPSSDEEENEPRLKLQRHRDKARPRRGLVLLSSSDDDDFEEAGPPRGSRFAATRLTFHEREPAGGRAGRRRPSAIRRGTPADSRVARAGAAAAGRDPGRALARRPRRAAGRACRSQLEVSPPQELGVQCRRTALWSRQAAVARARAGV